jgi:putative transposase
MKDSLWSLDLFRCESMALQTHWIVVVMDQFTRRIAGFSMHAGKVDGIALNHAISGQKSLPAYLCADNDPLFLYKR